jgi:hypothetical protein
MTQDTIKKIEEKIRNDGPLSEKRKTELLNFLLTTINPEVTKIKYTHLKRDTQKV